MRESDFSIVERKHSKKREAILKIIRSTDSHPTARWVYERLKPEIPDLSLGTVYRNISLFRQEGKVVALGVVNGEEHYDGFTEPHPHGVCECCGRVVDLPRPDEKAFASLMKSLLPFVADFRKTVFYGLCPACAARTRNIPQNGA